MAYKKLLYPLLDEVEGFRRKVYNDSRKIPTVGYGFNLNAPDTAGILKLHGHDVNALRRGKRGMNPRDAQLIRDAILDKHEQLLRHTIGDDLFNGLSHNKKAGLMSMMYNSPKLIGPKMIQGLATNDNDLALLQEVVLSSNKKKDPGTLYRRMREAELMSPDNFQNAFKAMEPNSLHELKTVAKDHPEIQKRYGSLLSLEPEKPTGILNKIIDYFK